MDKFEAMAELLGWINANKPKWIVARFEGTDRANASLMEYTAAETEEEAKEKWAEFKAKGGLVDIYRGPQGEIGLDPAKAN